MAGVWGVGDRRGEVVDVGDGGDVALLALSLMLVLVLVVVEAVRPTAVWDRAPDIEVTPLFFRRGGMRILCVVQGAGIFFFITPGVK